MLCSKKVIKILNNLFSSPAFSKTQISTTMLIDKFNNNDNNNNNVYITVIINIILYQNYYCHWKHINTFQMKWKPDKKEENNIFGADYLKQLLFYK